MTKWWDNALFVWQLVNETVDNWITFRKSARQEASSELPEAFPNQRKMLLSPSQALHQRLKTGFHRVETQWVCGP